MARDTFTRTVSNGWGTADEGGAWSNTGANGDYAVGSGVGTHNLSSVSVSRHTVLDAVQAHDLDYRIKVATDKLAVGAAQFGYLGFRFQDHSNYYRLEYSFGTTQGVFLKMSKMVANVQTDVVANTAIARETHAAATFFWVRVRAEGSGPTNLYAKIWRDGTSQPSAWDISGSDSEAVLQRPGAISTRTFLAAAVSNAPVVFSFDEVITNENFLLNGFPSLSDDSLFLDDGGTIEYWHNGLPHTTEDAIAVALEGTVDHIDNNFPFDAASRLVVSSANPVAVTHGGFGFDSAGRLCVTTSASGLTQHGALYDSTGKVYATLD